MSREEAALFRKREGLRLARQRVLRQIDTTTNPRHRKLLLETLSELDNQLSRLE